MDNGGEMDFIFRKHPAFSSLKQRAEKVPLNLYETDYRKVVAGWLDGITKFNNIGEIAPQVKYLTQSDEFSQIVGKETAAMANDWLRSVLSPDVPSKTKEPINLLSRFLRKATAVASLGLNYASVAKQALTQIPLTIIEKAPPKFRSKFAKDFGINVKDLPSLKERKGTVAIADMQGKIGRIFTGALTEFDKTNAQISLNSLLDKNYNKILKDGKEVTPEVVDFILKKSQDTLDLWYGGMTKAQLPPNFRTDTGKFLNMFILPLTSQLNGFFQAIYKAKGIKKYQKSAEVVASAITIAYMEQVVSNLSPEWSDKKTMAKDTLQSLAGNIPVVSQMVYAYATDQPVAVSAGISGISALLKELGREDKDAKTIGLKSAELLGLPKRIRKTMEGLKTVEEKGLRDKRGALLAPVAGIKEKIRTIVNGKYGSLEAKKYLEGIGKKKKYDVQPKFDEAWEMLRKGDEAGARNVVDSLDDKEYEEYKKVLSSTKRNDTVIAESMLEYNPKGAVEFIQSLPRQEANRIVKNFEDEQWEIYKNNK